MLIKANANNNKNIAFSFLRINNEGIFVWNCQLCIDRQFQTSIYINLFFILTSFLPDVSRISNLIFTPDNEYVLWFVCSVVALCLIGNSLLRKRLIRAVLPTFSGPKTTTRYGSGRLAALSMSAVSMSWGFCLQNNNTTTFSEWWQNDLELFRIRHI